MQCSKALKQLLGCLTSVAVITLQLLQTPMAMMNVSLLPLGCWQLTTSVRDDVDNCRSLILLQHVPRRWVCLSQQAGDAEFPTGGQWSNYSIIYEGP